jgi:multicomponent Na+:H+ antiporter subunit D
MNMLWAMGIASFLCIFIGSYTPYLYRMLPYPVDYHPYTAYHVSETLQILLFTALGFFLLLKKLQPEAKISLDLDWPYRMGGRAFQWLASKPIQTVDTCVGEIYRVCGLKPLMYFSKLAGLFDTYMIDDLVDGIARGVKRIGERLRNAQRGALQENLTMAFGVAAVVAVAFVLFF